MTLEGSSEWSCLDSDSRGLHEKQSIAFLLSYLPGLMSFVSLCFAGPSDPVCLNVYFHCVIVPREPLGPHFSSSGGTIFWAGDSDEENLSESSSQNQYVCLPSPPSRLSLPSFLLHRTMPSDPRTRG